MIGKAAASAMKADRMVEMMTRLGGSGGGMFSGHLFDVDDEGGEEASQFCSSFSMATKPTGVEKGPNGLTWMVGCCFGGRNEVQRLVPVQR